MVGNPEVTSDDETKLTELLKSLRNRLDGDHPDLAYLESRYGSIDVPELPMNIPDRHQATLRLENV